MNKYHKFNKILYSIIFTALTLLVFIIDFSDKSVFFNNGNTALAKFLIDFNASIKEFDIMYITLGAFIIYFYYNTYFDGTKYNKKSFYYSLVAILLTITTIICKSYLLTNSLSLIYKPNVQILKTFIMLTGYYLMYYAIIKKLFSLKIDDEILKKKTIILEKQINNHPIITSFVAILILWLPIIIISLPGISTGDSKDELSQFFHQDTSWSIESINLLNENVYINKHHSVFHTIIFGSIVKLGKEISSFNLGISIYTILQVILLLTIFSFMTKYMKKLKIPNLIIIFSILFIGLNPIIVTHALCTIKDTPNAIFNLLYVIFLLQIVRNYDSILKNKLRTIIFVITILLVLLLRNNGIYTFLLSFPFLFILYKDKWKKLLIVFLIPLVTFGIYDKVLLPSLDVSSGSIREVLSIPFMQLARTVKYKTDNFTEQDKEKINKVLDFENMKYQYDPDISDNVKGLYNKNTTNEELKNFFGVWFKYLKKYPFIYIESFVNSTYGYFYPEKNRDVLYINDFEYIEKDFFDMKAIDTFSNERKIYNNLISVYTKMPIALNRVAYYDWILLLSCVYIIKNKKYKYLIPMTPLLAILLTCLASPVNGSFRYILPIMFSLPIILSIDYLIFKENKKNINL